MSHWTLLVGEKKLFSLPGVANTSLLGVPPPDFLGVPRTFLGLGCTEAVGCMKSSFSSVCADNLSMARSLSEESPSELSRSLLLAGRSTSSSASSLFLLLGKRWGKREEVDILRGATSLSGSSRLPRIKDALRLSSNLLLARAP